MSGSCINTVVACGAKAAPYCIALPMAVYGAQHFIYLAFVTEYIPAWIPWRGFWTGFTGAALIAAAAGITLSRCDRWAATLLGTMIFLWVALLHTSRVAAQPRNPDEWRGVFQALAMSGFVLVLAGSLARSGTVAPTAENRFTRALKAFRDFAPKPALWFVGLSMIALGVQHFVFPEAATPKVPLWIPGTVSGNYLSGLMLVALGVGLLIRRTARLAATILGLMIFLSLLAVHLPVVLTSPRFESDWCKTFVMAGGAFLLAQTASGADRESGAEARPRR